MQKVKELMIGMWLFIRASLGGYLDIVKSYSAKQNIDLVYFSRGAAL